MCQNSDSQFHQQFYLLESKIRILRSKASLRHLHEDLTADSFKYSLQYANETDVHKANFIKSINKYMMLSTFKGKLDFKFDCNWTYIKHFCKYLWNKSAVAYGTIAFLALNIVFIMLLASLKKVVIMDELSKTDLSDIAPFLLVTLTNLLLALIFLIVFLFSSPGYLKRKTLLDPGNAINALCNEMGHKGAYRDKKWAAANTSAESTCFVCLCAKQPHMEHCKKCNRCVSDYQHHCQFFNKCVGRSNSRSYCLFLLANFMLAAYYTYYAVVFSEQWLTAQSSNWFYQIVEAHVNSMIMLDWPAIIAILSSEVYFVTMLNRVLPFLVALSKNMTMNELDNPWNYKHIFQLQKVKRVGNKTVYQYKHHSLLRNITNVLAFFLSCKRSLPSTDQVSNMATLSSKDTASHSQGSSHEDNRQQYARQNQREDSSIEMADIKKKKKGGRRGSDSRGSTAADTTESRIVAHAVDDEESP